MSDAIMDRVGGYQELVERARNAGIVTDYDDWQGKRVAVPAETLTAILEVLERRSLAADSAPGASARECGFALAKRMLDWARIIQVCVSSGGLSWPRQWLAGPTKSPAKHPLRALAAAALNAAWYCADDPGEHERQQGDHIPWTAFATSTPTLPGRP